MLILHLQLVRSERPVVNSPPLQNALRAPAPPTRRSSNWQLTRAAVQSTPGRRP